MSKKELLALCLGFSSLLLSACGPRPESGEETDGKEEEKIIINVETTETILGEAIATFKSTAVLEADRQATVTTKSSGIILDIKVEEGDLVETGDVMLVLESDTQALSLNSAKANYEKSLNNLKRAELMLKKGLTNTEQVENLQFETQSLKASYDQASMNLSFTQVKAPFAGMVVKRHVKIGNLIQNATAVFDVVDFDSLQAKISVPEHHWLLMKKDLPVSFDFDAVKNMKVAGHVERIAPTVDSNSGTFEVTVAVENDGHVLRPGLFAKAEVIYDKKTDVVLIDKDAIIREDGMAYVFQVDGEENVSKVDIVLGYEMLNTVEVTDGILAGQAVVTTGKNNLTPESYINAVNYK